MAQQSLGPTMDWFERLTGFREAGYADTKAKLSMQDGRLISTVNGRSFQTGKLELVSLGDLRTRAQPSAAAGKLKVRLASGDVRGMHAAAENAGALFQVASQFNMLEMIDPTTRPEDGVTRYQSDRTQGPACAIAAGAATIYRNYFVPIDGHTGQTETRQLDALAGVGRGLANLTDRPLDQLWRMRNGYALGTREGVELIGERLKVCSPDQLDALRCSLEIGLQWDAEVTDGEWRPGHLVSQAFCSALPVTYTCVPTHLWTPFASLVLEAAYEATFLAALINRARGKSASLFLTALGGGAFGNETAWIEGAMARAMELFRDTALDIVIVSYGAPPAGLARLADNFK